MVQEVPCLLIVRTDSHEITSPVKDRLTRNYIPCLEQRVLACVAPIASQFHSACLRAPNSVLPLTNRHATQSKREHKSTLFSGTSPYHCKFAFCFLLN